MRLSAFAVRRGISVAFATGIAAAGVTMIAPTASAADVSIDRVSYKCEATHPIIASSLEGQDQFYVRAETTLPDRVEPGTEVPPTSTKLSLTLSKGLVNQLSGPMKVQRVKGSSTSDVVLQAVVPGGDVIDDRREAVNGLVVPNWVDITPNTEVTIVANGTVDKIAVPDVEPGNGLIYVQMPKTFQLKSEMDPPVLGSVASADLECTRELDTAAARVIGTIPIGDGCSETDCPLPKVSTDVDPNEPGDSDGDGTDPDVITSVDPDDQTPVDPYDPDYGVDDNSESNDSGDVSSETTELPATGSSLGLVMAGLFAALAALRVGMAVRSRRGNA